MKDPKHYGHVLGLQNGKYQERPKRVYSTYKKNETYMSSRMKSRK